MAIHDETTGVPLGYGVIADVSEAGACVWTNGTLVSGSRLTLRVACTHPADVRQLTGRVVWESAVPATLAAGSRGLRRFGVEWQDEGGLPCLQSLREQALRSFDESLTPPGGALTRDEIER